MNEPIKPDELSFHMKGQLALANKQFMDVFNRTIADKLVESVANEPVNVTKKSISATTNWSYAQVAMEMDSEDAKEYDIYNGDDLSKVMEERLKAIADNLTDSDVGEKNWSDLKR